MSESDWAPVPSEQLGTISKMVAGYVLMPNDDEAIETAVAGVRRAIDRLNTRRWRWAMSYQDLTIIAGTPSYGLPSDFKQPRRFTFCDPDGVERGTLPFMPWVEFLNYVSWDQPGQRDPCYYSSANPYDLGTIYLDSSPSEDWAAKYPTARLWYFRRVTYPVAAADPFLCPSEVVAFIQDFACGFVADRYAPDKAALAYGRANALWRDLVRDDNDDQPDWE